MDKHIVPGSYVFSGDIVGIVECGTADRASGKIDRFQHGKRCEHAGAADRHLDAKQLGLFFIRRILESGRPFGCVRQLTDLFAVGKAVELYHGTVDIKGKRRAFCAEAFNFSVYFVKIRKRAVGRRNRKALLF